MSDPAATELAEILDHLPHVRDLAEADHQRRISRAYRNAAWLDDAREDAYIKACREREEAS